MRILKNVSVVNERTVCLYEVTNFDSLKQVYRWLEREHASGKDMLKTDLVFRDVAKLNGRKAGTKRMGGRKHFPSFYVNRLSPYREILINSHVF